MGTEKIINEYSTKKWMGTQAATWHFQYRILCKLCQKIHYFNKIVVHIFVLDSSIKNIRNKL